MRHILNFLGLFFLVSGVPSLAIAQQCTAIREVIVNFEVPNIGSYNLWDTAFGTKEQPEEFVSGFLTGTGGAVIGGHRFGYNQDDMSIVLGELDRRGRKDWVQEHKIAGVDRIYKLLPVPDGFWIIGRQNISAHRQGVSRVWIGMFDHAGNLTGEKVIAEKGVDLVPTDIIAAHDGAGFLLSVKLVMNDGEKTRGSRVYFLNSKGGVVGKKSFLFGLENIIQKIAKVGQGKYAAVGRIRDTHRRWAGWVMVLDDGGGIEWQREYSRGSAATIDDVDGQSNGNIVVSGIARPAIKNGDRAGWVMSVEQAAGDVVWQRYYVGKSNYVGRKLIAHSDGLISVLLSVAQKDEGKPVFLLDSEQKNYAHARLLTLSPRGQIFTENTYFNGVSAEPFDMFLGKNNERVIIGRSKVGYTEAVSEENPQPLTEYSQDFWAVAGVSTDPYSDPCDSFVSFLP